MRGSHVLAILFVLFASACAPGEVASHAQALTNASAALDGADALDAEEAAFLTLINAYRQQNGLGPLVISVPLTRAAAWLAQDMASLNYASHTDSLGRDPFTRMTAFGYSGASKAENIAAGNAGAQATFDQWKASAGHNGNMLHSAMKAIGIGRAYNAASTYGWYWATTFGSAIDP